MKSSRASEGAQVIFDKNGRRYRYQAFSICEVVDFVKTPIVIYLTGNRAHTRPVHFSLYLFQVPEIRELAA